MDVAVLIPVKSFGAAKGRLREALDDAQRAALAEWMARRVVAAVSELPTFVACDDDEVRGWARSLGAETIWGPGLDLNGAVDDGVRRIWEAGADHVIVSHADLPLPDGLSTVVTRGTITLVPDAVRDGTNVMSFPREAWLPASYGPASFGRHLAAARELPRPVEVRPDRDLALDIDTVDDLLHPLIRPLLSEVLPRWAPTTPANRPT